MCVVRQVEVSGRSEVCGWGGVDVGSGSMSVLLYCIGVRTCALCVSVWCVCVFVSVCVCVCPLLIKRLYICNVLHVPCCRVEQSADFRFEMLSCTIW